MFTEQLLPGWVVPLFVSFSQRQQRRNIRVSMSFWVEAITLPGFVVPLTETATQKHPGFECLCRRTCHFQVGAHSSQWSHIPLPGCNPSLELLPHSTSGSEAINSQGQPFFGSEMHFTSGFPMVFSSLDVSGVICILLPGFQRCFRRHAC